MVQLTKERADDIVQARTKAAAGHNACARLRGIEKQRLTRPRQLEENSLVHWHSWLPPDSLWNAFLIADKAGPERAYPAFAEGCDCHA